MSAASLLLLLLLAVLLLVAAALDLRSRIIPNRINALIAVLAIGWWIANGYGWQAIGMQILLALGVLILFAIAFRLNWMGGGDVKLLTALALWLPFPAIVGLLFWMALAGGVLTLVVLLLHRLRGAEGRPEVPYGVAIAAPALMIVTNHILTTQVA